MKLHNTERMYGLLTVRRFLSNFQRERKTQFLEKSPNVKSYSYQTTACIFYDVPQDLGVLVWYSGDTFYKIGQKWSKMRERKKEK